MRSDASTRSRTGLMVFSMAGLLLLALLIGVGGALFGWVGQVMLITLLVPAVLLSMDYRIGVVLLIVMMPFANSRLIPQLGPLSVVNMLLAGVCALYLLRWVLMRMAGKKAPLPVSRELLLYYVLPVTLACVIGTFHLGEIPHHFLAANKLDKFSLADYWISQYFKTMLLVLVACVIGAAVVEYGKAMRFATALCVAAVGFVLAMVVLIGLTGVSLDRLKDSRSFLGLLGRHNNEAGVMLTGALGPMLFMQAYVRHGLARWALRLATGLVICGIVATFSRGAFLGMLAILLAYVLHFKRIKTVIVVLVLGVLGAVVAPSAVWDRLSLGMEESRGEVVSSQTDELTAGRVYTWQKLAPEILRSPLWGRGELSTEWSNHVKTSFYSASHPHNMYLEILMDMGLMGAVAMFLFYRYIWRTYRWLGRDERVPLTMRGFFIGAWTSLLAMLIYGFSNGHYYPAPEQIFYWVSIGLAFGYAARLGKEVPSAVPQSRRPRGFKVPQERILGPRPAGWKPGT